MGVEKSKHNVIYVSVLAIYIVAIFCVTILTRAYTAKETIHRVLFGGYITENQSPVLWSHFYNVLLFVPIGILVSVLTKKYKLFFTLLCGLFVSETIECSQLIWHRGVFDVNDLFFNTLGAFVGGMIMVILIRIRNLDKEA